MPEAWTRSRKEPIDGYDLPRTLSAVLTTDRKGSNAPLPQSLTRPARISLTP